MEIHAEPGGSTADLETGPASPLEENRELRRRLRTVLGQAGIKGLPPQGF